MKNVALLALCLAAASCATNAPRIVSAASPARAELLGAVTELAGTWEGTSPEGESQRTHFAVIAGGSAVKEVMMPGEEHEMVNMYTLDGDALVMTHYCAGGNQPTMRATEVADGKLVFEPISVADLNDASEHYMGAMTIVFLEDGSIEEHWQAMTNGERGDVMVIPMRRVK